MKKLFIFLLFFSFKAFTQNLRAVVCDSLTKQALPSASIKVKGTKLGTMTNNDGVFSMSNRKGVFQISYIGYQTKEVSALALPDTILLSESNLLGEVLIMPDSTLKVILRKAFNSISNNYPQKPTILTSFYREIYQNNTKDIFNYFSENFLKIYTPPYTNEGKNHEGQVKVLKSRTIKNPKYAQAGIKYAGGPFVGIRTNRVLKRQGAINPVNFKAYHFELEKISTYEGKPIYIINCHLKDSLNSTKLYIDKESLAYIRIEISNKTEKDGVDYITKETKTTLVYDKKDNNWFLKQAVYSIDGETKDKESISHKLEFVTTDFETDSVDAFSYNEQLLRTEIIADQKNDLSENFFEGYEGTLLQTDNQRNQIKLAFGLNAVDSLKRQSESNLTTQKPQYQQNNKKGFREILLKANGLFPNFGFTFSPIVVQNTDFRADVNNVFSNPHSFSRTTNEKNTPILFNKYLAFNLTRRFILQYSVNNSIRSSIKVAQHDYGLAYRFVVNPAKKPIFIEPTIKYSSGLTGVSFGKTKNPDRDAVLEGKKLNAKSIQAGIYQRNEGIKLGLNFSIYSGKFLKTPLPAKLYVTTDYFYILKTSEPFFRIKEERIFGLLEKKVDLPLSDSRLKFSESVSTKLPKMNNNFWIGLSYRVVLR